MATTAIKSKGYCTVDDVASFLGQVLTATQSAQAALTIARAETFLDRAIGSAWLTGTVNNETYYAPFRLNPPSSSLYPPGAVVNPLAGYAPTGADIILRDTPVDAVKAVKGTLYLGGPETLLLLDTDYEIRDFETGWIRVTAPSAWYRIRVDYVPDQSVPGDIQQATIMLTASWLRPTLNPDTWGVQKYQLPDLLVEFAKSTTSLAVPEEVQAIIDDRRHPVIA